MTPPPLSLDQEEANARERRGRASHDTLHAMVVEELQALRALSAANGIYLPEVCPTPTPHTLHTKPYTLHPTPHTPHTTPYTLHPAPHTLHI